jgi:large subunit ribosomal protein L10
VKSARSVERAFLFSPHEVEAGANGLLDKEVYELERKKKEAVVAELTEKFAKAKSLTFCEFKNLTVAQADELRGKCRDAGLKYTVAKNSLIYLALPESVRDGIKPHLVGTTSVALDNEDGVVGPKTMSEFSKIHKSLTLKAGVLDEEVLDAQGVTALGKIPGRNELLAKILGSVEAPASNVLRCVQGVSTKLAGLLRAYHEDLEKKAA